MRIAAQQTSLWLASSTNPGYPALVEPVSVDVAVLGGGITGLSTALLLKREGLTVAVVDQSSVGSGATGFTTAKVSSLNGLIYHRIRTRFGEGAARTHGEANEAGLAQIARWVEEEAIDCDFRRKPNYTYALSADKLRDVENEVEAAKEAGLPASFTDQTDLPYPVEGAVRFENQAEFHPRKFVLALATLVRGEGSHVFENTRATGLNEGNPSRVETTSGTITAQNVVVATGYPIFDRGLYFARVHQERSYALGVRVRGTTPQGMYLSADQPTRTIRSHPVDGREMLIVGGESHTVGEGNEAEHYRAIESFAREHWEVESIDYQWATQDGIAVDHVPYIGRYHPLSHRLFVATGFRKWGLAQGVAAAMLLRDKITGRDNPWSGLYDPNRLKQAAGAVRFATENAKVARHLVGDRLTERGGRDAEELRPGEGAIAHLDGKKVAAYRDEAGVLHAVSPTCTHLGCQVHWNSGDVSWDCPCHGSRFSPDGEVLNGPAVSPLERRAGAGTSAK